MVRLASSPRRARPLPRWAGWLLAACLVLCALPAQATTYTFPTAMPAGCSGSSGVYNCGSLTLVDGDSIVISGTKPATISFSGNFGTGNTNINTAGAASDLTINVSGTLTLGFTVAIVANVNAGSVVDSSGYGALTGSIATTTGTLTLGYQFAVTGDVSSTTGTITLGGSSTVSGDVTSTSGNIATGQFSVVSGLVSTTGQIDIAQDSTVKGGVFGGSHAVNIGYNATVNGEVTSTSGAIGLAQSSQVDACLASTSGAITLGYQATAGKVCCGSGTCGTACVTNNSTWAMPGTCATPVQKAQYLLNESSWPHSAGDVLDSSGNAYHGTSGYGATAGGCSAPWGIFAGTTAAPDRVQVAYNAALNPAGSFTVAVWAKATAGAGTHRAVLSNRVRGNSTPYRGWELVAFTDDTWVLRLAYNNTTADTQASFGAVALNTWTHLTATFLSASGPDFYGGYTGTLKLYRDGAMVATYLNARYVPNNGQPLVIGSGGYNPGTTGDTLGFSIYPFTGNIDDVKIYSTALRAAEVAALTSRVTACPGPHHLQIAHASGSQLTCTPGTVTVTACADSGCTSNYTSGVTGTLTATGSGMTVNFPAGAGFTIASGSSSTTVSLQQTTVGSTTLGTSGLSPAATGGSTTCNFGSPSCTWTAVDAGLLFDVPNHVADVSQTVSVSAVKKADSSLACTPAFASVSKNVTFKCSYTNPTTGTLPVRVGGAALNASNSTSAACDAGGRAVSLSFNASGVASTTVQYADVGQVLLTGTYSGSGSDAGLSMTGTDSFVAAPSAFAIGSITAAPIRAGASFSATVTAQNASAAATPNFGKETSPEGATLTFTKRSPTGAGAATGTFSGSLGAFSAGAATASNLAYTEVGTGDLTATLTSGSYLGSGLTATGTTGSGGAVGRFMPHHFDVTVTPACAAGSFTYAGQPFGATVTARNAAGGTTLNYDGSASTSPNYAKAVTLSEPSALGVGSLSGTAIAAAGFTAGVGSGSPTYTYTTKQTGTRTLGLRAVDTDSVSSSGYTEGSTGLRSGRLRLSSAFGSASASLSVPVTAEYWSGNAWVLNSADSCTALAGTNVAVSNARNALGNASAATTSAGAVSLVNGQGNIVLAAPSPAGSSVGYDLALNLGSTSADQSCQASHPATTGAAKAWLRSANGSCSALWDRDPAARASFGIFSPETRKTVRTRELF